MSQAGRPGSDVILDRLMGLHPKLIDLSLGRLERLLENLDHPEEYLPPTIHVAGTNGKGSVGAILDAMLGASGIRSGLFTSPHLVRPHERIRIVRKRLQRTPLAATLGPTVMLAHRHQQRVILVVERRLGR